MKQEKHLGMRIDKVTHAKLKFIAEYEDRSIHGHVLYLIRQDIRAFEREHGVIVSNQTTGEE